MAQARLSTRLRFSPQVLVVLALAVPFFYCVREAIGAGIYAWYGATYRQVEFVAEEARPNDGYPYAYGHMEPGEEPMHQPLLPRGEGWVMAEDPTVAFAPGVRVAVWWSPQAPITGYGRGRYTNGMLVARLPTLPGALGAVGWSLAALGVTWLTLVGIARIGGTRVYRSEIPLRLE